MTRILFFDTIFLNMEFFFGLVAAAFFSFANAEEGTFFSEKTTEITSSEPIKDAPENMYNFLPKPENADLEVRVFLTFECEHCREFFFESLLPLKNKILEKKLPVSISLLFLPTNTASEKKIHEFLCVEQFAQTWETWLSAKILFESEDFKNEISEMAKTFQFPWEDFSECRHSDVFQDTLAKNISSAEELRIVAVPSIFLDGKEYSGKTPPENLLWEIEKKLGNQKKF